MRVNSNDLLFFLKITTTTQLTMYYAITNNNEISELQIFINNIFYRVLNLNRYLLLQYSIFVV